MFSHPVFQLTRSPIWPIAFCFGLLLSFWFASFDQPIHDFGNYYYSAQSVFSEDVVDLYDPISFNSFIQSIEAKKIFANYSPHPPFTRFFFLPLTGMNAQSAKEFFDFIGILLFCYTLVRINKFLKPPPIALWIIPILFFLPLRNNIFFGQSYLILFFFLAESFLKSLEGKDMSSAIYLSLAIILKFSPAILLLYFIFSGQWKIVRSTIFLVSSVVGIDLMLFGAHQYIIFLTEVLPRASLGFINITMSTHFQSFQVALKYLFIQDVNYNINPLFASKKLFFFCNYFLVVFMVVSAIELSKKNKGFYTFSFWLAAMILITPIGSTYSGVLFIFLAFAFLDLRKKRVITIGFLFLGLSLNHLLDPYFSETKTLFWGISLLLFSTLLFLLNFGASFKRSALIAFVFGGILLFKSFPDEIDGLQIDPIHSRVMNELFIDENGLNLSYLGENGFDSSNLFSSAHTFEFLSVLNNEIIFEDEVVVKDLGNIDSAVLVDQNEIVFLSDSRHGYHFYQLATKTL